MNPEELKKNIALYYSKLPPGAQAAFSSMEWLETLKQLSTKYSLSEKQIETLGSETTLVLLGIIHSEEYEKILTQELDLPKGMLNNLIIEVNNLIIRPIKTDLGEAFDRNNQEGAKPEENIGGKLDNRFENLPKNIRDAIGESNYQTALYTISKEYNLNVEQMGLLEESLVNIMLAKISGDKFEEEVKNKLKLQEDKMRELIAALNEKILKKIRANMMAPKAAPVAQMGKDEMDVLHKAGIKIVGEPDLSKLELAAGKIEEKAAGVVPPPPMLAQKLTDSFKIPTTKTEHTSSGIPKVPPTQKSYPKGADPYRLAPGE